MKKLIIIFSMLISSIGASHSQTIVKMNLPQQAKESLKVVVLFDEEVPSGMTVVLGLMGYQLNGGISPYTYEWYQNGKLIGTNDIVTLIPSNGDQVTLKVTDKNRCYSQSSINMKVRGQLKYEDQNVMGGITVLPTFVTNKQIKISLPRLKTGEQALIRFMDLSGKILNTINIQESQTLDLSLPTGSYFVSVRTDEFHFVDKIIVKN